MAVVSTPNASSVKVKFDHGYEIEKSRRNTMGVILKSYLKTMIYL